MLRVPHATTTDLVNSRSPKHFGFDIMMIINDYNAELKKQVGAYLA